MAAGGQTVLSPGRKDAAMTPTLDQRPLLDTLRFYVVHRYPHRRHPDETVTSYFPDRPDKDGVRGYRFGNAMGVLYILTQRWFGRAGHGVSDEMPELCMIPRAYELDPPDGRDPFEFTVFDLEAFGVFGLKYDPMKDAPAG